MMMCGREESESESESERESERESEQQQLTSRRVYSSNLALRSRRNSSSAWSVTNLRVFAGSDGSAERRWLP